MSHFGGFESESSDEAEVRGHIFATFSRLIVSTVRTQKNEGRGNGRGNSKEQGA